MSCNYCDGEITREELENGDYVTMGGMVFCSRECGLSRMKELDEYYRNNHE